MRSIVGLFPSRATAERGLAAVRALGVAPDRVSLLVPGDARPATVPTTDAEPPGVGPVLGGVVGGAVGASAVVATTAIVPGVGPVLALGLMAGALVGAVGGAAIGDALEAGLEHGVPKDEWFWYEEALRHGQSVLVVLAEDDAQAGAVRGALVEAGAESLDAARERWWIGLRPVEAEAYARSGGTDFDRVEPVYRRGFEAALAPEARGRAFEDVVEYCRRRDPDVTADAAYRQGFERGREYWHRRQDGETRTPRAA
jgi:hypothetical protein